MSYADDIFIGMCRDILDNGFSTEGEKVRPRWEDGTPAYTIKRFGVVNRYDLSKEFPILTLRRTALKSAVDEMLWIWQKKSNNIHDLGSHVWDEWADEAGSIGMAYGYQIGQRYIHHLSSDPEEGDRCREAYPSALVEKSDKDPGKWEIWLDQIDGVIYDLRNNPYSRRIMTNIYVHRDLHGMHLYPCAYSMTFNVTGSADGGPLILNGILNQRSQDVLAANNWNVVQYSVLLHMLARTCGMRPGELVHVIADAHIYDRHVDIIRELIERKPYEAPEFILNPDVENFYDFTPEDCSLKDYNTGEQINNIPIAV